MALIQTTPAQTDYRRRMAYELMRQGADPSEPVQHWAQGLAKLGQGALGGYQMYQADQKDLKDKQDRAQAYITALEQFGGSEPQATSAPTVVPSPAQQAVPMSSTSPQAGAVPAALAGQRPGGPVAPSAKVWGDAEAEAAGLYEPASKNVKMASALARPEIPAQAPTPAPQQVVAQAPQAAPQAAPRPAVDPRIIRLLRGNPAQQEMGAALADQFIAQQFKPSEYDFKERPDGTLIAVNKKDPSDMRIMQAPGGGQDAIRHEAAKAGAVEQAKRQGGVEYESAKAGAVKRAEMEAAKAVAKPEQDKQNQRVASIVTQDIDRALSTIKDSTLPVTGSAGNMLSMVGGTAAHDLGKLLDTVKSNAGFQELSKMRQASPTGAALGSVTERELALLQATIGNLEQSQSREQLEDNLRRVKNTYLDVIHGEGSGPPRETLKFQKKPKAAVDPAALDEARRRGLVK